MTSLATLLFGANSLCLFYLFLFSLTTIILPIHNLVCLQGWFKQLKFEIGVQVSLYRGVPVSTRSFSSLGTWSPVYFLIFSTSHIGSASSRLWKTMTNTWFGSSAGTTEIMESFWWVFLKWVFFLIHHVLTIFLKSTSIPISSLSLSFFWWGGGLHQWHVEVLELGMEPEPLPWQCWILNPLLYKRIPFFFFL